jgi:hypothetical protein
VANISANNFLRENSATKWFKNLFVNEGFLVVTPPWNPKRNSKIQIRNTASNSTTTFQNTHESSGEEENKPQKRETSNQTQK